MTYQELKAACAAAGLPTNGSPAELQTRLDAYQASQNTPNLTKWVGDEYKSFAASSDAAKNFISSQKAREYPDETLDIVEGEYTLTDKIVVRTYHDSKYNRNVEIPHVAIVGGNGTFIVPFANLVQPRFPFEVDGVNLELQWLVANQPTTSRRNQAVLDFISTNVGMKVRVKRYFGTFNNPNKQKWLFSRLFIIKS